MTRFLDSGFACARNDTLNVMVFRITFEETFTTEEILHYVQDDNVKARVFLSAAGKLILPVWVCFQLGSYFSRFLFVFVHISCFFT